jgi:hypothetical protein
MMDCLRRHGLAEHLVVRWRAIEERFRKQIVKTTPFGKKIRGVELPFEGLAAIVIAGGSLCDDCGQPMNDGDRASYHVRTGRTYCGSCRGLTEGPKEGPGVSG